MSNLIHCHDHGECEMTFVCIHLTEPSAGRGFNRAEPSEQDPFPDAWCDDCELIREQHQGWDEESEKLMEGRVLCSGCYEQSRIRNTRTDVSFEDLASLRWKCDSCDKWHYGPCLDFSYFSPAYWSKEDKQSIQIGFFDSGAEGLPTTFLDQDICIIYGEHYFVRGIIHLPIIGTVQTFGWGVWGSLSRENFEKLLIMGDDPKRVELPPMFSWLSNRIDDYPDTLNLKMYAHIQEPGTRPIFELEPTDHPLSQEYHHGITAERVREIMTARLDLPVM
jgi:hypothetical protein